MVDYYTGLFDYSGGNNRDEADVINDQRGIEYEISEPDSQRDTRIFYKDVGGVSGPYENDPDIYDPSTRTTQDNKEYSIDWEAASKYLGYVPPESADSDDESSEDESSDDREATDGWEFIDRDDSDNDENDVTGRLQWGWRGGTTKWKFLTELDSRPQSNLSATDEKGFKYREEPYEKSRKLRQDRRDLIQIYGDRLGVPNYVQKAAWKKLNALPHLNMGSGNREEQQALGALTYAANERGRRIRGEDPFDELLEEICDDTTEMRKRIRTVRRYIRDNESS